MTAAIAQGKFEKQRIDKIDISFGGTDTNAALAEQYRLMVKDILGPAFTL